MNDTDLRYLYADARAKLGIRDSLAVCAATDGVALSEMIKRMRFDDWAESLSTEKASDILFTHEFPPIPIRQYDWAANRRDWDAETNRRGFGPTPLAAALALLELDTLGEDNSVTR